MFNPVVAAQKIGLKMALTEILEKASHSGF